MVWFREACVRCPLRWPDPAQRTRLVEIRDNLIAEAEREDWLGEVEGLRISLAGAKQKLGQIDQTALRQGGCRRRTDTCARFGVRGSMWQRTRIAPGHSDGGRKQFGHSHRNITTVDRMWQKTNRIHAVQGPIVTVSAVRRRLA